MSDKEIEEIINKALLRIADNVAKHIIQRSSWSKDDKCFQVDLRESRDEIVSLVKELTLNPLVRN